MNNDTQSLLELRKFVAPEFIFGLGARKLVGRYAKNCGARKVLLVTDKFLREHTLWIQEMRQLLTAAGLESVLFDQITPNPRSEEAMEGARLFHQEHCNTIVAIGGGSVMDCAKGIGIVSSNGGHVLDFEGVDRILRPMPPLLCLPTTSGTASEVSQFAIIMAEKRRTKIAIVSKAVVPDAALIDPELTVTMPPELTACTGLDALTHAIEAYVSNASSPVTDLHALEAIRLIGLSLPTAWAEPNNLVTRSQMLLASLEAGLAFSNAILGAVHAMAHSLGGFLDLPHGECNAILLAPVIRSNMKVCPERYQQIALALQLPVADLSTLESGHLLCNYLEDLRRQLGVSRTLGDLGVQKDHLPLLAEHASNDACLATNPRDLTVEELEAIYEQAL